MNFRRSRWSAFLLAMLLCTAGCERKPAPQSPVQPTPRGTPDKQGFIFGEGFHKEESSPTANLRWVQQDAVLDVVVPADGRYRLTFRPITVFSSVANTITINVAGARAGEISTQGFDLAHPMLAPAEVTLHSGENELRLHSERPEVKLGEQDDRTAAYGLVLPITIEPVP